MATATRKKAATRRPRRKKVDKNLTMIKELVRTMREEDERVADERNAEAVRSNKAYETKMRKAKNERLKSGVIEFHDLDEVLKPGDMVVASFRDEMVGGILRDLRLTTTFMGQYWSVEIQVISVGSNGQVSPHIYYTNLHPWKGAQAADTLSIRKISDVERDRLTERGKIFREVTKGSSYMNYSNELLIPSWWEWTPMSGHGRVMIDGVSARMMEPRIMESAFGNLRSVNDEYGNDDGSAVKAEITDDKLFMTWPMVVGFSFRQKRWGVIHVGDLTQIEFDKTAFQKLVLEPEKKDIIKSLVEHSGEGFKDIVKGKSGGFIFLLHGAPGAGKTLTAEATAEVLERPLYIVSVGELGTSPEALESKLSQILELADRWNAVLLLDESDVFLEQRTDHDLVRNAMVGIFLRLLEYFNGVMFLTTNRVKNFDKAFHSRISLALSFPHLTKEIRSQIWKNLLEAANINDVDVSKLEDLDLNGRQIKNCIRLTQTMALAKGTPVTTESILTMTKFADDFTNALKNGQNFA